MRTALRYSFLFSILFTCLSYTVAPVIKPRYLGRFGDNLSCLHVAIAAGYKYNLKVVCDKFHHSDELIVHTLIPKLSNEERKKFKNIVYLKNESQLSKLEPNTLYFIDYYVPIRLTQQMSKKVNEIFRQLIQPRRAINYINLPKDRICVAVHVRKGGGFDFPIHSRSGKSYADIKWPTKFPPDSFYIEQIKKMFELLNKKPLYVHIFTDDQNPAQLVKNYKKVINNPLISFGFRNSKHFDISAIDDFFSMCKFDCLIRPASSFSFNVERISNFKITISPAHAKWVAEDKLVIDKVNITIKR